ncbi:hypothetical protein KC338_g158 [Hortaea werneckii]|nr:hypothetical protein KC338_g158 [Hortaea werneckii]
MMRFATSLLEYDRPRFLTFREPRWWVLVVPHGDDGSEHSSISGSLFRIIVIIIATTSTAVTFAPLQSDGNA